MWQVVLVVRQVDYLKLMDDVTEFEEGESKIEECQDSFMNYVKPAEMYLKRLGKELLENGVAKDKSCIWPVLRRPVFWDHDYSQCTNVWQEE